MNETNTKSDSLTIPNENPVEFVFRYKFGSFARTSYLNCKSKQPPGLLRYPKFLLDNRTLFLNRAVS